MKLENIKVGAVFKNYRHLCRELNVEVKSGNSKMYQYLEFKRYFDWNKDGYKLTITEVFENPKVKIDGRGKSNTKYKNLYIQNPELCNYIIDDYGNDLTELTSSSKVEFKWKCSVCEDEYIGNVRRSFRAGVSKCRKCSVSSYERRIMIILDKLKVNYIDELKFSDLKGSNNFPLRFDFGIHKDDNLICIIEFDGGFHDTIEDTMINDVVKNEYCIKNNIDLLRINHRESDYLEVILLKKLHKVFPDDVPIKEELNIYISEVKSKITTLESAVAELKELIKV